VISNMGQHMGYTNGFSQDNRDWDRIRTNWAVKQGPSKFSRDPGFKLGFFPSGF